MSDTAPLLDIKDLVVDFHVGGTVHHAVQGISLSLYRGRTLGVVGESGCGKSVTSLSIMRLVPQPPGRYADGAIRFDGTDILSLDEAGMRALRGGRIGMIFQEPMTSLNPVYTCGAQIEESLSVIPACRAGRRANAPSRCWTLSVCRRRGRGSTIIRTSCPAGSGNA